ncbi:MAG: transporter substrate-binding domain-containing protein, partial [Thiomonas sp.]|nr:transporter substrate-binding domain-containing protein [Thiomonas sp.]
MDSPILKTVKIGFEDGTPPMMGLKMRGLLLSSTPFDTAEKKDVSPKSTLQAVQDGKVNVMITWEPAIGYFMKDYPDLTMTRVPDTNALGSPERYLFFMSMAVKPKDKALKEQLDKVIESHKTQIAEIMNQYNVHILR